MSSPDGEVVFERVTQRETPQTGGGARQSATDQGPFGGRQPERSDDALPFADVDAVERDGRAARGKPRFPLVGPIVDDARKRELKGRCSRCDAGLRVRAKGPGAVRVRCPICGHTRRIEL